MKNLAILFLALGTAPLFAQDPDHPHYEKHYGDVEAVETDEVRIEIIRPHSQESFTQFTAKIFNKTQDYILIQKDKTLFKSDGNGEKYPKEATIFIEPGGDVKRPFKIEGGPGYKVDRLSVKFGGFSRAEVEGIPVGAGEFKMKPEKNSVMMAPFAVTVKKWRYTNKELTADFRIRYRGEAMGMIDESKIRIRKEDGTFLENTEAKDKPFILSPMKTRTVNVIRPFQKGEIGKGEAVYIDFGHALLESASTTFEVPGFSLTYDESKTKEENK